MTDTRAAAAVFVLLAGFFAVLVMWPIQATEAFDFWRHHAAHLRASRTALIAWRLFYGAVIAGTLGIAILLLRSGGLTGVDGPMLPTLARRPTIFGPGAAVTR